MILLQVSVIGRFNFSEETEKAIFHGKTMLAGFSVPPDSYSYRSDLVTSSFFRKSSSKYFLIMDKIQEIYVNSSIHVDKSSYAE
jgi:hypothetical protein